MENLSPLHIGTGRENYDTSAAELHSDTLSAALAAVGVGCGVLKGEGVETFLKSFALSSAFPYYEDHYFLPKMQGKLQVKVKGKEEYQYRKQLKKVKFVEASLWKQLAAGQSIEVDTAQLQGPYLLAPCMNMDFLSKRQVNQRANVCRDGDDEYTEPFYFEWMYFHKKAGLYCLTDATGDTLSTLQLLFTTLGENGVGTDRSVGGGAFTVRTTPFDIPEPEDADTQMTLSLYIPTTDEADTLIDSEAVFSLLLRGGYMAGSTVENLRHLKKKSVYAFGVGSMFSLSRELEGRVVNIQPDVKMEGMHPVWRSGRALCVKIKRGL